MDPQFYAFATLVESSARHGIRIPMETSAVLMVDYAVNVDERLV